MVSIFALFLLKSIEKEITLFILAINTKKDVKSKWRPIFFPPQMSAHIGCSVIQRAAQVAALFGFRLLGSRD